jgi:hypothetical protein
VFEESTSIISFGFDDNFDVAVPSWLMGLIRHQTVLEATHSRRIHMGGKKLIEY